MSRKILSVLIILSLCLGIPFMAMGAEGGDVPPVEGTTDITLPDAGAGLDGGGYLPPIGPDVSWLTYVLTKTTQEFIVNNVLAGSPSVTFTGNILSGYWLEEFIMAAYDVYNDEGEWPPWFTVPEGETIDYQQFFFDNVATADLNGSIGTSGQGSVTLTPGPMPSAVMDQEINGIVGSLSDGSYVFGLQVGVAGSWSGLLRAFYFTGLGDLVNALMIQMSGGEVPPVDFANLNVWAGFVQGSLTGDYGDPVEEFRGGLPEGNFAYLSGSGTLSMTDLQGQVDINRMFGITIDENGDIQQTGPPDMPPFTIPVPVIEDLVIPDTGFFYDIGYSPWVLAMNLYTTTGKVLGVWGIGGEGDYSNPDQLASWTAVYGAYGTYPSITPWDLFEAYRDEGGLDPTNVTYGMIGEVTATDDNPATTEENPTHHVSLTGDMLYLDERYLGIINFEYLGTYTEDEPGYGGYGSLVGAGTIVLSPLAYNGWWGEMEMAHFAALYGLMGGVEAPWYTPADFTAIGRYNFADGEAYPALWNSRMMGATVETGEDQPTALLALDGTGIFQGFTAGILREGNDLTGDGAAVYGGPDGTVGFLTSYGDTPFASFIGAYYPEWDDCGGMWAAEGTLTPYPVAEMLDPEITADESLSLGGFGAAVVAQDGTSLGTLVAEDGELNRVRVMDQGVVALGDGDGPETSEALFGVWSSLAYGSYTVAGETDGPFQQGATWGGKIKRETEGGVEETLFWRYGIDSAADGEFTGKVAGAGADWVEARTYVSGGEIKGLYSPADLPQWNAVAIGGWMETGTFLDKVGSLTTDAEKQAFMKATKIPCIEVGSVNLTGATPAGGNSLSVNMAGVKFFSFATNTAPAIWATGSVTGNYTGNPAGSSFALTPANAVNVIDLNAQFNLNRWQDSKWGAAVTGSATVVSPINFQGAAAGTYGDGALQGTGAGIAGPQPPPE